jgi:hypothetical protein
MTELRRIAIYCPQCIRIIAKVLLLVFRTYLALAELLITHTHGPDKGHVT